MNTRLFQTWFVFVLLVMLTLITWASLQESLFNIPQEVTGDPWFITTMFDVYFAFFAVFFWMAYKLNCWWSRLLWLVLVVCLGNVAIAAFMLWQLARLPKAATVTDFLLKGSGNQNG